MPHIAQHHHQHDIVELRLERAPVNALDPDLCAELRSAIDAAVDGGAEGLVLSGGPKVFSAGLDVPFLLTVQADAAALRQAWNTFFDAARALAACPVPVVAAIGGHAPAGGCVLALCCDYRVMADGPFAIGLNETQVGIGIPPGILRLMRRTVGRRQAERLLVAGEMVPAARAHAIGLVDELTGVDEVVTRAAAWLQELLRLPRKPMLATRRLAREDLVDALTDESLQLDHFLREWHDPDTQQALREMLARIGKG
ncbi:enoyl-CoA hydratase/isomerase family protein [Luteimonas sp. RD2P54]|uniref:Enoyl-CoA hydratase/isomerase family protein n=1 Tax=Luteimonas endophytica TaxID=3042023 RepID=A0ABT6JBF4_9GAMM|nr:enoyl-CoA hydratase/isomerase family protein [Luteimonas endophytica]MDH5824160.1 enoyl-CoA hydratase/isomerase family protein [Luteimonas endophytica]